MRRLAAHVLLALLPLQAAAETGPPAPADPVIVQLEQLRRQQAEAKRVADGTFLDGVIIAPGVAADLITTGACEGCRELNPLVADSKGYPSALKAVGWKAAAFPVELGACYLLRRWGHHGWARVVAFVFTGIHLGVSVHNLKQGEQTR